MPPEGAVVLTTYRVVDEKEPKKVIVSCSTAAEAARERAEQEKKDKKHGNKRVLTVVKHEKEATRGKEIKKVDVEWEAPEFVAKIGKNTLAYLPHPKDLATLGKRMRHCSGTHFIWASEVKVWYFFALLDEGQNPIGTLHAKAAEWVGKAHPLDSAKKLSEIIPPKKPKDAHAYWQPAIPRADNSSSYITFDDVLAYCKEHKFEYQPGTYRPEQFDSNTYEHLSAHTWGAVLGKAKPPKSKAEWKKGEGKYYTTDPYLKRHIDIYYEHYVDRVKRESPVEGIRPIKFQDTHIVWLSWTGRGYSFEAGYGRDGTKKSDVEKWWDSQLDEAAPLVDPARADSNW